MGYDFNKKEKNVKASIFITGKSKFPKVNHLYLSSLMGAYLSYLEASSKHVDKPDK